MQIEEALQGMEALQLVWLVLLRIIGSKIEEGVRNGICNEWNMLLAHKL